MMNKPKISVLMTVYNGGELLRQSIGSVLNQSYQDFELLIVNDCSSDNSLEVIASFADPRIVLYSNPVNLGQTKSLNIGLKLAKGDYIARIDADDMAFAHWLETQIDYVQRKPRYCVVSSSVAVIDSDSRLVKVLNTPLTEEDILLKSLIGSPINHVGSIMRKAVIVSYGGYDENYKIAADYQLWSKLLRNHQNIICHPDILVAIRVHEKSVSRQERGKRDLAELVPIMSENIKSFTKWKAGEQDVTTLWRLIYDVDSLNAGQFQQAVAQFHQMVDGINKSLFINEIRKDAFRRRQLKVIFMKKIFSSIKKSDAQAVRITARDYCRAEGFRTIFALIYLLSFFGMVALFFLPWFYEQLIGRWARFRLNARIDSQTLKLK